MRNSFIFKKIAILETNEVSGCLALEWGGSEDVGVRGSLMSEGSVHIFLNRLS